MKRLKAHQSYFTSTGQRVPSVTTLIGGNLGWGNHSLVAWARKNALAGLDPNEIRDQAGRVGTVTHGLIEQLVTGRDFNTLEYPPTDVTEAKTAYGAFKDWWEKQDNPKVLHSELQLAHDDLLYGGTLDLVPLLGGRDTLVDFKTSSGVYGSHRVQVAGYAKLYEFHFGVLPPCLILHLDKVEGVAREYWVEGEKFDAAWDTFLMILRLDQYRKLLGG